MLEKIDKRARADLFRLRLAEAMVRSGLNQSDLARATGADRSTISALLQPGTRLPNAQLAADCAAVLGVSCDWLLGLATQPEPLADVIGRVLHLTDAPRALFDAEILRWHREAAGNKIRHVPASLPDLLKTEEVVRWEYAASLGAGGDAAIEAFNDNIRALSQLRSDLEIALPRHEIESFAAGSGYWAGLDARARAAQLDRLIAETRSGYPALRLYLYDARQVFSAPVTVFGSQRAVVYLGHHYLVFEDPARVAVISRHFDGLLRATSLSARDTPDLLQTLRDRIPDLPTAGNR